MSVTCTIVDGPLGEERKADACAAAIASGESGAIVRFDGIVRRIEGDDAIVALDYEVYEPMTSRELGCLAADILRTEGVHAIDVLHSRGRVPVGAVSFRLAIAAAHRKEALRAADVFIDRMKRDVPIWKRAVR